MTPVSQTIQKWPAATKVAAAFLVLAIGSATAYFMPFGFIIAGLALICIGTRYLDLLALGIFWTLPYMIATMPTGAFTLKAPEATAYIFAASASLRAILRKDTWQMPPATPFVLIFLGVCCLSTAFEPTVSAPFVGSFRPMERNSPDFRSLSLVAWMGISWFVVVALYNVIRERPGLFKRCVIAHCYSGGVASVASLIALVLVLAGVPLYSIGGGKDRDLVTESGSLFRLAGVAYEPLFLAFYFLTVIPATITVLQFRQDWGSVKWLRICLGLQCFTMLLTFSAGGIAGLVAAVLVLAFLLGPYVPASTRRKIAKGGAIFAVVTAVAFVAVQGLVTEASTVVEKIADPGHSDRESQLVVGWNEFVDHPLLGVGPGMSNYTFPKYAPNQDSQILAGIHEVDEVVLSVLGEVGAIGALALIACAASGLGAYLRVIYKYGPNRVPILTALTASLIGIAVQFVSLPLSILSLIYFTGILAIAAAAYLVEPTLPEARGAGAS